MGIEHPTLRKISSAIDKIYYGLLGPFSLVLIGKLIVDQLEKVIFPAKFGSTGFVFYYGIHTGYYLLFLSTLLVYFVFILDLTRRILPIKLITPPYRISFHLTQEKVGLREIKRASVSGTILTYAGLLAANLLPAIGFVPMRHGSAYSEGFQNIAIIRKIPDAIGYVPILDDLAILRDFIHSPTPTGYLLIFVSVVSLYWGMQNIFFIFRHRKIALRLTDPKEHLVHNFAKWMPHVGTFSLFIILIADWV